MHDFAADLLWHRSVAMYALIGGAVLCVVLGFVLFVRGTGLKQGISQATWETEVGKVAMSGMSVGAVMMASSGIWVWAAVKQSPTAEGFADGGWKITEFVTQPVIFPAGSTKPAGTDITAVVEALRAGKADAGWRPVIYVWPGQNESAAISLDRASEFLRAAADAGAPTPQVRSLTLDEARQLAPELKNDSLGGMVLGVQPPASE